MGIFKLIFNPKKMTVTDVYTLVVNPACLKTTMICSVVLLLKQLFSNMGTGGARVKSGGRPPEDQKLFTKEGNQDFDGHGRESSPEQTLADQNTMRKLRIVQNDLENVPIGMLLMFISLLVSSQYPTSHMVFTILFTFSRIVHTVSYELKLQPHRALGWFGAVIAMLGFAVIGIMGIMNI